MYAIRSYYERGGTGTIGSALSNIASFVSLNGFANTGFYWDGKDNMHFDQSEVNLLVTANINENLSTEFNMEFRNNGEARITSYNVCYTKLLRFLSIVLSLDAINPKM